MARYTVLVAVFFIVFSIAGSVTGRVPSGRVANEAKKFHISGKVYCDPCRVQFPTELSYALPNTTVILACRNSEDENTTYEVVATTDADGQYNITAIGDHQAEICEVRAATSADPNCREAMDEESRARVSLTYNAGVDGQMRYANPVGFLVKNPDPRCKEVLDKLGLNDPN